MGDTERELKQALERSFRQFDAAWNAHLVRLAARIDALTGLVLALGQRLGLDREIVDQMLTDHEEKFEMGRLVKIEDHNPAIAALAASFLERWEKGSSDSPPNTE